MCQPPMSWLTGELVASPLIKSSVLAQCTLGEGPGGRPLGGQQHPGRESHAPRLLPRRYGARGSPCRWAGRNGAAGLTSVCEGDSRLRAATRGRTGASGVRAVCGQQTPGGKERADGQIERDVGTDLPRAAPSPEPKPPPRRAFLRQWKGPSGNVGTEGFTGHRGAPTKAGVALALVRS